MDARGFARRQFVVSRFPKRPKFGKRYIQWIESRFDYSVSNFGEVDLQSVASGLKKSVLRSSFWPRLCQQMESVDRRFRYDVGSELFEKLIPPQITQKSFGSFLRKTHRFNVSINTNWPEAPDLGWVSPGNWFGKINDIVRTKIVVRQTDGAIFLANWLENLAADSGLRATVNYHADDDGYYGIHIYLFMPTKVLRKSTGKMVDIVGQLEIQVITQLHETIRQLLHQSYRRKRNSLPDAGRPWQWRYRSDEFALQFIGHGLQNIDGLISRFREEAKNANRSQEGQKADRRLRGQD
jgi:hypothetical protein